MSDDTVAFQYLFAIFNSLQVMKNDLLFINLRIVKKLCTVGDLNGKSKNLIYLRFVCKTRLTYWNIKEYINLKTMKFVTLTPIQNCI